MTCRDTPPTMRNDAVQNIDTERKQSYIDHNRESGQLCRSQLEFASPESSLGYFSILSVSLTSQEMQNISRGFPHEKQSKTLVWHLKNVFGNRTTEDPAALTNMDGISASRNRSISFFFCRLCVMASLWFILAMVLDRLK